MQSEQLKTNRKTLFEGLNTLVHGTYKVNLKDIINLMKVRASYQQPYGCAHSLDFRELTQLFALLFAYDNKRYYVYKAVSDPTKIGYLSRRQYTNLQHYISKLIKQGVAGSSFTRQVAEYLKDIGTMGSPYKMLKRAFKENPQAKFLARFFPLAKDKKTTVNESILIELCNTMMCNNTNIEFQEAPVQECYDLRFHDNISGSGNRYATNSCMCGRQVGKFYEAFGAKGMIVYKRGQAVGRFLLWSLPDGKQYVDRLYIREAFANDALAEIDRQFPDAQKYPNLRSGGYSSLDAVPQVFIPMTHPEVFKDKVDIPYIDTFGNLMYKDGTYLLSNFSNNNEEKGDYVMTLRNTSSHSRFMTCPHCNRTYFTGHNNSEADCNNSKHKLYCTGYMPRTLKDRACIRIFRDKFRTFKEARRNDARLYGRPSGYSVFEVQVSMGAAG